MTKRANEVAVLAVEGRLPSFEGAAGWLNTTPLDPVNLRGKVVLVEFWTYSCVNWLRVQPYVRAWAEKYRDHGLVVIGVHTPEFEFEKSLDNIRRATRSLRVDYPVAIDSDYRVWRAFGNQYWPALYFVDAKGNIRHHQFGEGGYEHSESVIQALLAETGATGFDPAPLVIDAAGVEAAADWDNVGSPETYVGVARRNNFVSTRSAGFEASQALTIPEQLSLNQWGLAGDWSIGQESATSHAADGRIAFRFRARDVNLVMGSASAGGTVRFRLRIDGDAPGRDAGLDICPAGNGLVAEPRLYQLVRQQRPIVDQLLEIQFLDPCADLFVFTFG